MHIHSRFLMTLLAQEAANRKPVVLDYGCGAGEFVSAGRRAGFEVWGVEAFYGGNDIRCRLSTNGLLGHSVFELQNGKIPFPAASFDTVVTNQVFEHVAELDHVVGEIERVLVPGGRLICICPVAESFREPHCGVPWAHRMPMRYRYGYLLFCRLMGLGFHTSGKTRRQWCWDFIEWLDQYTHYRSHQSLKTALQNHFAEVRSGEPDYLRFRLRHSRLGAMTSLVGSRNMDSLLQRISLCLANAVFISTKSTARDSAIQREMSKSDSTNDQIVGALSC